MKRAIFLGVFIIIIAAIIYFIIKITDGVNSDKASIVFLQIDDQQNNFDKLIDEIIKMYDEGDGEIELEFYFAPGIEKKVSIETNIWDLEDKKEKMKDTINDIFLKHKFKDLSNEEANVQMGTFIHILADSAAGRKIFLFGAFPDCYKDKNVNKVIKDFEKNILANTTNNNTVYWMIRTNDDEPEQKILEIFKKYKIEVENKQINVRTRECNKINDKSVIKYQSINLEYAIFSEIDTNIAKKILSKSLNLFSKSKNISVGLVNANKSTKINYTNTQLDIFKNDLIDFLKNSKDVNWHRYKFIFKSTFDKYRNNLKDTAFFFLAGKKPARIKRLITFRNWRRRDNQKIFLHFTPKSWETTIKNTFQNIFLFETI